MIDKQIQQVQGTIIKSITRAKENIFQSHLKRDVKQADIKYEPSILVAQPLV